MQSNKGSMLRTILLLAVLFIVAAIVYYLGFPGALNSPFLYALGYAVLSNYAIILAIGIAIAMADGHQGAAGLAAFLGYEVILQGTLAIQPNMNVGVKSSFLLVIGIIAGILAGLMYNRFHSTKLPTWLGFFGGRRFVPLATGTVALFIAIILGHVWH